MFKILTLYREDFCEPLHHLRNERIGLLDGFSGLVDEPCLNRVPASSVSLSFLIAKHWRCRVRRGRGGGIPLRIGDRRMFGPAFCNITCRQRFVRHDALRVPPTEAADRSLTS